jgi:hypothetical protein
VPERPGDMDERDVDARFASIVAAWGEPVPDAAEASLGVDGDPEARDRQDAGGPAEATGTAEAPRSGEPAAGVEPADKAEPADRAEPVVPPSPWVTPAPLDVVVPASAWRTAETRDPGTDGTGDGDGTPAELEDDHFEPPEVVLPPQEDLHFWGAVIGLVAGPLMLLYVVFARPFHSTRWFIAAVVVSLIGFGLLVLRQPAHRDPTSGDDGARV